MQIAILYKQIKASKIKPLGGFVLLAFLIVFKKKRRIEELLYCYII